LLHGLGEILRAAAQRFEGAALRIDGAVRIAISQLSFRFAHGLAGAAELIHLALPLLTLAKAMLAQLLHELFELVAQRALVLLQLAHLVALLALLSLLALLAALSALATLVLTLLERAIAQLLLLADHVAKLVERRHHVVVAIHRLAGSSHLQVFQHLLQFLQQLFCGIASTGTRHLFEAIDHAAQILRAQLPRVGIKRPGQLLRILSQFLRQRLQELVERGAQLIGKSLDFLVARTTLQGLTQSFLGRAQRLLGVRNAAIFEMNGHIPHAADDFAQLVVVLRAGKLPEDRSQP
jgi:hypothetical protein